MSSASPSGTDSPKSNLSVAGNALPKRKMPIVNYSEETNAYAEAWADLTEGLQHWRLWTLLAWNDLHQRYKRTWIGMGWIALSFALFALVKIFIFGPLTGKSLAFFGPFLAMGFLAFRLISNFIANGANVYVGAQSWIKSEPLPLSVHLYKLMTTNFIIFFFASIPAIIICLAFQSFHPIVFATLPLALIIFAINGVWVSSLIGILCTRHRDIMHFVSTIMQVMYFATPILWVPPETGLRATLANVNPLTHYLAVIRTPALENTIPWESWKLIGIYTVFGCVISFIVFAKSRRRLIYWL